MNPWTAIVVVTAIICATVIAYGYMTEYIKYKRDYKINLYERKINLYKHSYEDVLEIVKKCFAKISISDFNKLCDYYHKTWEDNKELMND